MNLNAAKYAAAFEGKRQCNFCYDDEIQYPMLHLLTSKFPSKFLAVLFFVWCLICFVNILMPRAWILCILL